MSHATTTVAAYLAQPDGSFIANPAVEAAARRLAQSHGLPLVESKLSLSEAIGILDQFAEAAR